MTDDEKFVKSEFPTVTSHRHDNLWFVSYERFDGRIIYLSIGRPTEAEAWDCAARTIVAKQEESNQER